jgi:hypothetical protein
VGLSVVVASVLAATALARQGDPNASGQITEVIDTATLPGAKFPTNTNLTVRGKTENGYLWLGCTFFPDTNNEIDKPAVKVKGTFTEKFPVPLLGGLTRGEMTGDVDYAVALWRWKVSRSECHDGDSGGPCDWCRKNGYHLEDRVDRATGTWTTD